MDDQLPNPSKPTLYGGLAVLITFVMILIVYFIMTIFDMAQQWGSTSGVFIFNKGVFYIPGILLGLMVLLYAIVRESVLRKHLTDKIASYCTRTGIASVVIMFAIPNLVEYGVERYFEKSGYQVCDAASHQWLHSKVIVYAMDDNSCTSLSNMKL